MRKVASLRMQLGKASPSDIDGKNVALSSAVRSCNGSRTMPLGCRACAVGVPHNKPALEALLPGFWTNRRTTYRGCAVSTAREN
jgi:hypothetical protein